MTWTKIQPIMPAYNVVGRIVNTVQEAERRRLAPQPPVHYAEAVRRERLVNAPKRDEDMTEEIALHTTAHRLMRKPIERLEKPLALT